SVAGKATNRGARISRCGYRFRRQPHRPAFNGGISDAPKSTYNRQLAQNRVLIDGRSSKRRARQKSHPGKASQGRRRSFAPATEEDETAETTCLGRETRR